ncbi:MAG: glycosyltransferase family 9 protein [Selenomonadaceae bacterium]
MIKLIKSKHFDLSISFDRKLRPALLCFLSGIPVRVGPDKVFDDKPSKVTWLYTDVVSIKHDLANTLQAETYQEIIRGFTGIEGHEKPVFDNLSDSEHKKADELLARLPKADKKIALCVKGTFALKTWPKEYFAEVVNDLNKKYNAAFFVVGAPNDKPYSDEVIAETGLPVENFCGETSLTSLAALLSKVDLFVTVDTGATHIAATTGVKMVTMYGCTSPNRWYPYNDNARVMSYDPECCPCSYGENDCPYVPKPKCLWEVTPDKVLEACYELLA